MYCFHNSHQPAVVDRPSSLNIDITLGRMRTVPSLLMVLEMRSGMEMRRFDPIPLSFRNPAMAYRSLYSARHTSSSNSTPPHPCSVSDATSSCIISSVTTSPTLKSRVSGLSMSICTSVISCAYPSLCDVCPCVTQYSKGLLLTAAIFHVTTRSGVAAFISPVSFLPTSSRSRASSYVSQMLRFIAICPNASCNAGITSARRVQKGRTM
mmetsp:Transcript_95019/g.138779  ORF Transcript_95019/g.138779 Transcript_95019/m.138779 type:complete len:209 (-) Transcript_95019:1049-1675(-)